MFFRVPTEKKLCEYHVESSIAATVQEGGRRKFRRQKFRRQKFRRKKFRRISKSRNFVVRKFVVGNFVVLIRITAFTKRYHLNYTIT